MTRTKPDTKPTPAHPHPEPLSRRARLIGRLRGTVPRPPWGALGLLAAGLIFTVLGSLYLKADVESAGADRIIAPAPGRSTPVKKTVLVLFPYQIDLPHSVLAMQAIKDEFGSARDLSLDLHYEYLDINFFPA